MSALNRVDEAAGRKPAQNSLLRMLASLGHEYSNLLKASEKLQRLASARDQEAFDETKRKLVAQKVRDLVPIAEAICDVSFHCFNTHLLLCRAAACPWTRSTTRWRCARC